MRLAILFVFILFVVGNLSAQVAAPEVLTDAQEPSLQRVEQMYQEADGFRSYASSTADSVDHIVKYRSRIKHNNRPLVVDHYFLFEANQLTGYRLVLLNTYDVAPLREVQTILGKGVIESASLVADY